METIRFKQTPFSTISFGIPTSWESEQIILEYLKVRQRGLGKTPEETTTIFPKLSYFVVDGYNLKETDPYFYITKEVAKTQMKCTYPDILCYSKEDYDKGAYFSRMGCRSRVEHSVQKENGEYLNETRFNWGVQTLSLPNLLWQCIREHKDWEGKEMNEKLEIFLNKIKLYTPLMEKAILWRYDNVKKLKPKNAPILFMNGGIARLGAEDSIEYLLKSSQSSVSYGYIGIGDVIDILSNRTLSINDEEGHNIGMSILTTIREEADKLKAKLKLPVSVYGTPAESSIYSYFATDLENYGDIIPEWLKQRGYYTNSFHYPSEKPIDAFEKIKAEAPFHKLSNGGNITYVENNGKSTNWKVAIELIQYAYNQGIEYFGINTVTNKCFECGYVGEIPYDDKNSKYVCPNCGNSNPLKLDITLRLCGYLGKLNMTRAVKGRMKEMNNRYIHTGFKKGDK